MSVKIKFVKTNQSDEFIAGKQLYGNCFKCKEFLWLDPHHRVKRRNDKLGKYLVYLCRKCHTWVEEHPRLAAKEGLYISGYKTSEYREKYGR